VKQLGEENDFAVDRTEEAGDFTDENLAQYAAVMFLLTSDDENTPEDVLNDAQKAAFERFVQNGGGFVGVHSASDTGYGWPWYEQLVGAYFADHPMGALQFQEAEIVVENPDHPSTAHLPDPWLRTDEWYNFRTNPRDRGVNVLLRLDTESYVGSTMEGDHPIAWSHENLGGRAWYTAGGHTEESYGEELFLQHLLGGILYAAGR
jgi:cytochrome c